MSDDVAIKVENVSKDFILPHKKRGTLKSFFLNPFSKFENEKQHALHNVSFEIKKGEFFGIVGRNGSGKSTLLKCMAGVYSPTKGNIKVNGSLVPFIELGVGFNPELSGRDNVYLNGSLLGFSRKEIDEMYQEIVDFAELEKFMDLKLKNYSSGMQVRLAFSIAIRAKGDILLLDEVLAVGDAAFQQKCFNYFEILKRNKKTVVLVTHAMDSVKRFCNRAVFIENGKLNSIGSPDNVSDQYLLKNIDTGTINKNANTHDLKLTEDVSDLSLSLKSDTGLESNDFLSFEVKYTLTNEFNPSLAFTISREGISIAEVNTINMKLPNTAKIQHTIIYKTSLSSFNPGLYKIDIALWQRENRKSKAQKLKATEFLVKGSNPTKGGAMNLEGKWEIQK
ncbi:MAG TPA: ABC transporter ATP-binding protein [Candidatus Saccharimonadales bacterium]|nr:ABC transporter ATP-binding protein [Candidatus Saccharimonadales bacterium]